jgi:predicted metalloprotease
MDFDDDAKLDTSQIDDREGRGGGGGLGGLGSILGGLGGGKVIAGGGGLGIIGVIIAVILSLSKGGSAGLGSTGTASGDNTAIAAQCQSGANADADEKCAIVASVNSVQAYWSQTLPNYTIAKTVLFTGQTQSACGTAQTGMGPFYCPLDQAVYLDRGFFDEFRAQFGAQVGTFAQAYVLAHEYGHHVTDLQGNLERAQQDREGPESGSVRVELQADCYAGVWANHATSTGFIAAVTDADIADGLDAAGKVGDDYIQKTTSGQINPESFTHGTSEQRQRWFTTGYQSGDPNACDTFSGAI